jgi:hypothetical protein
MDLIHLGLKSDSANFLAVGIIKGVSH